MVEARRVPTNETNRERQASLARELNVAADIFTTYFFAPLRESSLVIPTPTVYIAPDNVKTQASYQVNQAENRISTEVRINSRYLYLPEVAFYELLLHQQVHLYQKLQAMQGNSWFKPGTEGYHNAQFVELCKDMGLNVESGSGLHTKPAGGEFAELMKGHGFPETTLVEVPPDNKKDNWWDIGREKPKGSSTLFKYVPDEKCPTPKNCSWRSGRKEDDHICNKCGAKFFLEGTSSKKTESSMSLLASRAIGTTTEGKDVWVWEDENGKENMRYLEPDEIPIARIAIVEKIDPNNPLLK